MIGSPPLPHQAQKQNLELGTLRDYPVSFFSGRLPGRGRLPSSEKRGCLDPGPSDQSVVVISWNAPGTCWVAPRLLRPQKL